MQRARGAYFANRHDTFWKELNFNFPEHHFFLKFIKKSLRKSKKSENCQKFWVFFRNLENFGKSHFFSIQFSIDFFGKFFKFFRGFLRFSKSFEISKKNSFVLIFSMNFLWISFFFDVLESWSSALSKKYHVYLRNMLP